MGRPRLRAGAQHDRSERRLSHATAVRCSVAAQALSFVWEVQRYFSAPDVVVTGPVVLGFVFSAVLLIAMACRRNWARIVWVMLYVFDSATEPLRSWILSSHPSSLVRTIGAADAILVLVDVIALALVFLPSSSRWFTGTGPHSGRHSPAIAG